MRLYNLPITIWTREQLDQYPDSPINIAPRYTSKLPSQRFYERHYRRIRRV